MHLPQIHFLYTKLSCYPIQVIHCLPFQRTQHFLTSNIPQKKKKKILVIPMATLVLHGFLLLLCFLPLSTAMPPPNPLRCNQTGCFLYNSYGVWGDRKDCKGPNAVVYPTTEEELKSALANAKKNNLKVKVVTKFSHTIPKWACPPSSQNGVVLISSEKYNSNIDVDVANLKVTVDAGVGLRELIDKVEKLGLSLVTSPYWEGVTVAGLISTGAHGSSWWGKGGAVHDHVIGLRLIVGASESEGYAKIINLEGQEDNPLLNAAKVSLGMLGVISKVLLNYQYIYINFQIKV